MRASSGLALGLLALAGCADPMAATDGIMPVAGLAQTHNARAHVIAPAGLGGGANPGGSGPRAARVMEAYRTGTTDTAAPAATPLAP